MKRDYRTLLSKTQGKQQLLAQQLEDSQARAVALADAGKSVERAQVFIQTVARETQEQLRFRISDIVQLALDTCFPDEYTFNVDFDIQRGRTVAQLSFLKDGHPIDPMSAAGGGVVDLASFALRVASWTLGTTDNVIVLDEPFRFVSVDIRPRAAAIVRELSERLHVQYIIVTHDPTIVNVAHRIFEVSQRNRVSQIKVRDNK